MLADQLDYVVGVDPHRDSHALAVVHVVSDAIVFESTVVASSDGYAHALKLVDQHAPGRRAFAVEGTGSFGAGLTRFLTGRGEHVLEVGRLRRDRRSGGKTDALDAISAARSVLTSERPATPRAGGERQGLQALGALHMILVTRKRSHPATIAYIERRLQEGKTRREANRCLKRYLARSLYRLLEHPPMTA